MNTAVCLFVRPFTTTTAVPRPPGLPADKPRAGRSAAQVAVLVVVPAEAPPAALVRGTVRVIPLVQHLQGLHDPVRAVRYFLAQSDPDHAPAALAEHADLAILGGALLRRAVHAPLVLAATERPGLRLVGFDPPAELVAVRVGAHCLSPPPNLTSVLHNSPSFPARGVRPRRMARAARMPHGPNRRRRHAHKPRCTGTQSGEYLPRISAFAITCGFMACSSCRFVADSPSLISASSA